MCVCVCVCVCLHACTSHRHQEREDSEHEPVYAQQWENLALRLDLHWQQSDAARHRTSKRNDLHVAFGAFIQTFVCLAVSQQSTLSLDGTEWAVLVPTV